MSADIIYSRTSNWIEQPFLDETQGILVPVTAGAADFTSVIHLNETAWFIYEKLEEPKSEKALCDALNKFFETDANDLSELQNDVKNCLNELKSINAVQATAEQF